MTIQDPWSKLHLFAWIPLSKKLASLQALLAPLISTPPSGDQVAPPSVDWE